MFGLFFGRRCPRSSGIQEKNIVVVIRRQQHRMYKSYMKKRKNDINIKEQLASFASMNSMAGCCSCEIPSLSLLSFMDA